MKSFIVFLSLAIGGTVAQFTYKFDARRVSQTIPSSQPVIAMDKQVSKNQQIYYVQEINDNYPLNIDGYIINPTSGLNNSVSSNACKSNNGVGWDDVAAMIISQGLMPDAQCPVESGDYTIDSTVKDITATFSKMIDCGKYNLKADLTRDDELAMNVAYQFNIKDDGSCNA